MPTRHFSRDECASILSTLVDSVVSLFAKAQDYLLEGGRRDRDPRKSNEYQEAP